MIVYRLCKEQFRDDLSGFGAQKFGGRWNSKGISMVYCGETRALCTTEIAVHSPYGNIPDNYYLLNVFIPNETVMQEINIKDLADGWNYFPQQETTQMIGDRFIKDNKFLVLKVPSATVQGEHNFLINPNHPDSKKIKIIQSEEFTFDKRLFVR